MTDFVNTAHHDVYVEDPERQDEHTSEASGLLRVAPHAEVEATGRLAEVMDAHKTLVRSNSKEGKAFLKKGGARDEHDLLTAGPGDKAFPVPEDERAERSGLHITGRDSGVPVASEAEPGDTKDGSGDDPYEGVAAVEAGEVTRGDTPLGMIGEQTSETDDLNNFSKSKLAAIAKDRGIKVKGTGKKGGKLKQDYVDALSG